ncbi:MAG TPA: serine/threonine-protein kinase, partial [Thermoanaerobaculia bacterium]|nr:serine/threonine-protein kinase [Thermoanaerobaculia bacterium]
MLTQVGKYTIEEKVGVGGFGTVYKGRDPFIKRAVAIKTCQSDEEEIRKRFFREAEFAGNLHHRNITTIYDFGVTDDGTPYIVQEFLTGDDLDKLVKKREPMTLKRKLAILVDVCEGLGYAHTSGIIHRDIKPSNVRILEDGTVKLMDFGIAKSMVSPSTLTQTGITLGTASYLAPEQIRGEALDPRTDIFSLGVLAYELVTGAKPFTGDHISTVLYKIMNEHPAAPSTIVSGLPRALDAIILRALEKDRARRYASCAELKAECAAVLAGL